MSTNVYVDAIIYWNGVALPETNNVTIKIERGIWEIKPYYSEQDTAYVIKQPTWTQWSVDLTAFYDDLDSTTQDAIKNNQPGQLKIYPSRSAQNHWTGNAVAKSVEHAQNPMSFSEISCSFESDDFLKWTGVAIAIITEYGNYIVTEDGKRIDMEDW